MKKPPDVRTSKTQARQIALTAPTADRAAIHVDKV